MSKVKPILYMLGKGGISVLQTAIFIGILSWCSKLATPTLLEFSPTVRCAILTKCGYPVQL